MRQDSYKVLARFFAERDNVTVSFRDNATPCTDGDHIVLPSEVGEKHVTPLMGAVLHETAHIKHSGDPRKHMGHLGAFGAACVNALEDIRVDYLTSVKYPRSYDFIRALCENVIERQTEGLRSESAQVQVMKGLILHADGIDPARVYSADVVERTKKLLPYIDEAKACKTTADVVPLARRLCLDIAGAEDKIDQETMQKLQGAQRQAAQSLQDMNAAIERHDAASDTLNDQSYQDQALCKELRKQAGTMRRLQTMQQKAAEAAAQGDAKAAAEAKKLAAKLPQKQAVIDQIEKQRDALAQQRADSAREYQTTHDAVENADRALNEASAQIVQALDGAGLNPGAGLSLSGFSALDANNLQAPIDEVPTRSIDELVREALLDKKLERVINEGGARINNSALSQYRTAPERLFENAQEQHCLTKIAFVLDVSGSMNGWGEHDSLGMAFKSLDILMRSTKAAIEEGAPADVALYAFGTTCKRITDTVADYDTRRVQHSVNEARHSCGGGTKLLNAVNQVQADLAHAAEKKTIIVLTDAQVAPSDLHEIVNGTSGDCSYVFIAVNGYLTGISQELFGDNNIRNSSQCLDIIGKALLKAI